MTGELSRTVGIRDPQTGTVKYYGPGKVTVDAETGRKLGLVAQPEPKRATKKEAKEGE